MKKETKKTQGKTRSNDILGVKKIALKNLNADHFGAILEDISEKFSIMIEGHKILEQKMISGYRELNDKMDKNHRELNQKMDSGYKELNHKMDKGYKELNDKMDRNFKTVLEYLSRMDQELQDIRKALEKIQETKANREELSELKNRVSYLETMLLEIQKSAMRESQKTSGV